MYSQCIDSMLKSVLYREVLDIQSSLLKVPLEYIIPNQVHVHVCVIMA